MNKIQRYQRIVKQMCFTYTHPTSSSLSTRNYCVEGNLSENVVKKKKGNDVNDTKSESINMLETPQLSQHPDETEIVSETLKNSTFASLLRHSKFIDLGDPQGKQVVGTIYQIIGNDLYIDFGWKFHCVCIRPKQDSIKYTRGSKVLLRIKDLELSTRFLGATSDLTILEADCILLDLLDIPLSSAQ
ncbi:28S ribosomal protein S28, mitochondrial [Habropoda laboriosa]|uniref:28S ribosomal protein S28, mitochondrial n=1 Tax=Habropoda laboriosa TaxID=597456 RepID=A0A0L7RIV5_9HYME|nr:PREDICTED: 28S ribosomal protein S28, mitochondrial [Habropoda laboriosa]KOC70795.1 28S ribosomal protein S28, mitochondrial [Habropoda laboriosa]